MSRSCDEPRTSNSIGSEKSEEGDISDDWESWPGEGGQRDVSSDEEGNPAGCFNDNNTPSRCLIRRTRRAFSCKRVSSGLLD